MQKVIIRVAGFKVRVDEDQLDLYKRLEAANKAYYYLIGRNIKGLDDSPALKADLVAEIKELNAQLRKNVEPVYN